MKSIFLILGNQLFPTKHINKYKDLTFFMCEDLELCSYQKHHKLKIILFLSSMRSYADTLRKEKYKLKYFDLNNKFEIPYVVKLEEFIIKNSFKELISFEIEDKFFEKKINKLVNKIGIKWKKINSPMFLTSRSEFKNFLEMNKKPMMSNFYKLSRKKIDILMDGNKPKGGKWSYDEDNRKRIPSNIKIPDIIKIQETDHTKYLKKIVTQKFSSHPGDVNDFWFPTTLNDSEKWLDFFIKRKLNLFGDYEDAVDINNNILFHSVISPLINLGLITPGQILEKILKVEKKIKINSYEGFIRQIIGWREFVRGIYQNYEKPLNENNFFKNNEIKPTEVYNWFMEMYVDSSDWVMAPNVYGMGLFSDGGIFSTKPYICGSNYLMKMMNFKKGGWNDIMDGLYWRFINKNRIFFSKNPRLNMMVRIYDKMNDERKEMIIYKADVFIKNNTL